MRDQFDPNLISKLTVLTLRVHTKFQILWRICTLGFKTWKNNLAGLFKITEMILANLVQRWSNFGLILPVLSFQIKNFKLFIQIDTQGFKTCRKVALFGFLGQKRWFWPIWSKFEPILAKIACFWPSTTKISNFYEKFILRALKHVEKWPCLDL